MAKISSRLAAAGSPKRGTLLTTDLPEGSQAGPFHVGLYTYDNDGGV